MSSDDDLVNTPGSQDDLFGSDDDDVAEPTKTRNLSDEELDSGDDEDRRDRVQSEQAEDHEAESRVARILETDIARHPLPKPIDGELNTLRLPNFLSINPYPYDPETFEIPTTDHHSDTRSKNFSASAAAATTLRHRKNAATGQLESNTVVYKWSDGSYSVAVGPEHYELQSKPLAPPKDKPYQPLQDSHTYLASPAMVATLLHVVGHMSNQYTVRPNKGVVDEALEKLQSSLAAAARRGNKNGDERGPEIITTTEDPELQKKQAELAEKERLKAQRRREIAAEKANFPRGYSARGGLNVGDLEGRPGRRAPSGVKRAGPKRKAGGYDSEEDEPRGRGYGDEYVNEDNFLASSDEEEEPEGDDDEEEDILDDGSEDERPKAKRAKVAKDEDGSDADADADLDDDEVPTTTVTSEPTGRGRNRHVIEDDDDE